MLTAACLILLAFVTAQAQDNKEWRPVPPEDLSTKTPTVEPDADAEALLWEVRIDDSASDGLTMRHYIRVKIFNERGREKYSKFDIPFVKGMKIKELAARVIKPDGTPVEIAKTDIFEREIIKAGGIKIKAKSFAVPNIEPGVIVEYRYKEYVYGAGAKGMRLAFQRDIPVRDMSYYYKPDGSSEPHYEDYNFTDKVKFVKDQKGYWLASRKNVPAFHEEPQMPPADMVRPWMLLTGLLSINRVSSGFGGVTYSIKIPGIPQLYWGGVAADFMPLMKQIYKPSSEIKKTAADLTAGVTAPEDKLRKLYDYAQTQIKNTTYDPTITEEERSKIESAKSISDVMKRKAGSYGEIDLLFASLVAAAGLEARLALTGDKSEMFFNPDMTNENFIHPAAIAVKIGEEWKFLKPGSPFVPYGMLPWHEEDTWGLLISDKDFKWKETPFTPHDKSQQKRDGNFKLLADGTLEGTVHMEYTGHAALTYRMDNWDDSADKRVDNLKEELKARFNTAEITDIKIENVLDASKPLVQEYKIRIPSYAQKTGKRLFFQPGFFEYGVEPLFSSASRKYDVVFRYPWSEADTVKFELPADFDLDNADAPGDLGDPQKISLLSVTIGVDRAKHTMEYRRKFYFGGGGNTLFPVASYQPVKGLFDAFHKIEAHTITLKQK